MYDLPDSFTPTLLVGKAFLSLTFAENVVVFHLGDVAISAQFAYEYHLPDQDRIRDIVPPRASGVLALIGLSVDSAMVVDRRELEIRFANEALLAFPEDPAPYESYIITHGDNEWVV